MKNIIMNKILYFVLLILVFSGCAQVTKTKLEASQDIARVHEMVDTDAERELAAQFKDAYNEYLGVYGNERITVG